ncbi:hypothetical protein Aduo_014892 [Ancylostoma duodenale]
MLSIRDKSASQEEESEEDRDSIPEITIDESHFPASLFGHQFAMDTTQDYNFQQLLKSFDNLEMQVSLCFGSFVNDKFGRVTRQEQSHGIRLTPQ